MFSRKVHNLRYLGFGDLVCKNAAFADAVMMHMGVPTFLLALVHRALNVTMMTQALA